MAETFGAFELVRQIAEAGDLWVPDAPLRDELEKLSKAVAQGSAVHYQERAVRRAIEESKS
ncbi:MAG: hypothetical protein JWO70_2170 [Betaproteobacteria bacterium]|jgi:hypothetical protein|nr:hypothetical protein [Betaproteobacteria bacterium]